METLHISISTKQFDNLAFVRFTFHIGIMSNCVDKLIYHYNKTESKLFQRAFTGIVTYNIFIHVHERRHKQLLLFYIQCNIHKCFEHKFRLVRSLFYCFLLSLHIAYEHFPLLLWTLYTTRLILAYSKAVLQSMKRHSLQPGFKILALPLEHWLVLFL